MANKLKQVLQRSQKSWLLLIQSTAWIAAVIASFVLPPPIGTEDETKVWVRFSQFVITIFIGLIALFALRWSRKKHTFPWAGGAASFLLLGTVAFFAYQFLANRWTAEYSGSRVLIGHTQTSAAAEYRKENPTLTNSDLLLHFAGQAEKIWTPESINERRLVLAAIYILTMPLFTICIISLAQAIHCATVEKPARRRRPQPVPAAG